MTSNIRRLIASQVFGLSSSIQNELATKIKTFPRKNLIPQFVLPMEEVNKLSAPNANLNESNLSKIGKNGIVTNIEVKNDDEKSYLHFEVEKNFFVKEVLSTIINTNVEPKQFFAGSVNFCNNNKENIAVEFSSPNIAKPFHVGHLRSTIIGNFIANICEKVGHRVHRINYLGDWGSQFGVLSKGYEKFGDEDDFKNHPSKIKYLYEVYVKASKFVREDNTFMNETRLKFKNLEDGDEKAVNVWKKFVDISKEELDHTYKDFGIHFDEYEFESQYSKKADVLCDEFLQSGITKIDDNGAHIYDFNHPSGLRKIVLKKKDGTNLYLTRDVAAAIDRMNRFNFSKILYVVENGQNDHFMSLKDILKSMNKKWVENLIHVKFGRLQGMSTRAGKAVFLNDILNGAQEKAKLAMKNSRNTKVNVDDSNVSRILGASCLIVNDLQCRRLQDRIFSRDVAIQPKGDSGIFLHYAYARICSIKLNSGIELNKDCDVSYLTESSALELIGLLSRYEEVIDKAFKTFEACYLIEYLIRLAQSVNVAIKHMRVKGESLPISQARLLLFTCAQIILSDGMRTVGLRPLEAI